MFPISVDASEVYLNRNETWGDNLTGVFHSSLVFGDIDSDGDMDIVSSGCTAGGVTTCTSALTYVYLNNGNSLVESQTWQQNLAGVGLSTLALGDIENDGDLDLVLAGDRGGFNGTIKVYINNGNTFNENSTWESNLTDVSVIGGSVALGDVNNDGRLDLALVGTESSQKNGIYINNGTSFIRNYSWIESMPYVGRGSGLGVVAWGDVDGDGYIDLVFSGSHSIDFYDNVYINNGTNLIANSAWREDFGMFGWPSLTLGDYDNDGDLDLTYMGTHTGDWFYTYHNTGDKFALDSLISGYFDGSVAWGDYDNDGDLDLAPMGKEDGRNRIFNNNNTNFEVDDSAGIDFRTDDMQQGSLAWIDIDDDGDLDLVCNGNSISNGSYMNRIYISNSTALNTKPDPPNSDFNYTFNFSTGQLSLSWGNGSDIETPTLGLYFNLRVGTCSGCHDIVSGMFGGSSNPAAGYFGNMMQRKSITLNRPDLENKTIYWAVQTIDTGLAKSEWSEEQVFEIVQFSPCTENWVYGDWSSCVGGQQTRTATDLNSCGTEENKSATVQSCSSPPSGPSGPSGPATAPDEEIEKPENVTGYFEKIKPGVDTGVSVDEEGLAVRQLWVKVKSEVANVAVDVRKLETLPSFILEEPEGEVYQYVNITYVNLPDEEVEEGKVMFKVEKEWIEGNSINESSVRLMRYSASGWEELETVIESEDSEYVHYKAYMGGFSIFAIAGNVIEQVCIPLEFNCEGNELMECSTDGMVWTVRQKCEYGCENSACKEREEFKGEIPIVWYLIIAVLVVIVGSFLALKCSRIPRSSFP